MEFQLGAIMTGKGPGPSKGTDFMVLLVEALSAKL